MNACAERQAKEEIAQAGAKAESEMVAVDATVAGGTADFESVRDKELDAIHERLAVAASCRELSDGGAMDMQPSGGRIRWQDKKKEGRAVGNQPSTVLDRVSAQQDAQTPDVVCSIGFTPQERKQGVPEVVRDSDGLLVGSMLNHELVDMYKDGVRVDGFQAEGTDSRMPPQPPQRSRQGTPRGSQQGTPRSYAPADERQDSRAGNTCQGMPSANPYTARQCLGWRRRPHHSGK